MPQQRIKKLRIRAISVFHFLQDSVGTYDIELEDCDPKMFHKVPDGLESPHPDAEKNGDTLLSLD